MVRSCCGYRYFHIRRDFSCLHGSHLHAQAITYAFTFRYLFQFQALALRKDTLVKAMHSMKAVRTTEIGVLAEMLFESIVNLLYNATDEKKKKKRHLIIISYRNAVWKHCHQFVGQHSLKSHQQLTQRCCFKELSIICRPSLAENSHNLRSAVWK